MTAFAVAETWWEWACFAVIGFGVLFVAVLVFRAYVLEVEEVDEDVPAPETSGLVHRAVLWVAKPGNQGGRDSLGQVKVTDEPVEIPCRWDDSKREMQDDKGNTVVVDASAVVAQDVPVGSTMLKRALVDLGPGTGVAFEDGPLMYVVSFNAVPDVRGRATFREVLMQRQSGALGGRVNSPGDHG